MKIKQIKEVEVIYCDFCNKETGWRYKCFRCEKDICYECLDKNKSGYRYETGVFHASGGDGIYCNNCNTILKRTKENQLFNQFQILVQLRIECNNFNTLFETRRKVEEKEMERLMELNKKLFKRE